MIEFRIIQRNALKPGRPHPVVYLLYDNWDDFTYKTLFIASLVRSDGVSIDLGSVKIAYIGQPPGRTIDQLPTSFFELSNEWFSLGQDVEYYKKMSSAIAREERDAILSILGDVAFDETRFFLASNEKAFVTSLTRSVSISSILEQYRRVLRGEVILTNFNFRYSSDGSPAVAPVEIDFKVEAESVPSTNIHVLIGRNGVGKTTLLNNMTGAALRASNPLGGARFTTPDPWDDFEPISETYFSSVVSVSFSAFDPFIPPPDQPDRTRGTAYFYVGMKKARAGLTEAGELPPKSDVELREDLVSSLMSCLSQPEKRTRWLAALKRLQSDCNFAEMSLAQLGDPDIENPRDIARSLAKEMSSGHAIVLLTMTKLVELVEEKTLVLMDEPESHLHPPLLSALTRSLSDLLHTLNGVAIIATHSPVVAQEVPRTCVWKLSRSGNTGRADRPLRETFGENVGVLTHEIFGLEVAQSGFHDLLQTAVNRGASYTEIVDSFGSQLGHEARAILLSMVSARDQKNMVTE